MHRLSWLFGIALVFALAACGGNDDTGASAANTSIAVNDEDGSGDSGAASGRGIALVTAGDESFEFSIECQFGTGIVRGGGLAADGTPAFLDAGMPIDDNGKPANDPSEVGVTVHVGKDTLFGRGQYQYRVGPANGSTTSYSDDGSHAEGIVQFEYATKDGAREGLAYFDRVEGTFEVTCP